MKIEGYKEITEKEWGKLGINEGLKVFSGYEDHHYYFKKIEKFLFEDRCYRIKVFEDTLQITYIPDEVEYGFRYSKSFPILLEAVKKAEEIMKKELSKK